MIKSILFATDFSRISERAESYVTQIAGAANAHVFVLHAIEPIAVEDEDIEPETTAYMEKLQSRAEEKSREVLARLRERGIDCEVVVKVDKRWKAVLEVGDERDVDLIVIGSHRVRDQDKVYLGTTSHKVFFATVRPVMVVPLR